MTAGARSNRTQSIIILVSFPGTWPVRLAPFDFAKELVERQRPFFRGVVGAGRNLLPDALHQILSDALRIGPFRRRGAIFPPATLVRDGTEKTARAVAVHAS